MNAERNERKRATDETVTGVSTRETNHAYRRRCRLGLAALGLLFALCVPCSAQMGGVVTTGTVNIGSTPHPYAVVFDTSTATGYYIRIWLEGDRIMQVWASEQRDQFLIMNYLVYRTMGQHWTTQGGVDRSSYWRAETAGELQMDGNTIPANTTGFVTGYVGGWGRRTHYAHTGANVEWYSVRADWWKIQFYPTAVNSQVLQQWQQFLQQVASPQPPKKDLKDVTVNRHQVVVQMWDHAKEDGDIVDLYLNGQYLRRIRLANAPTSLTLNLVAGRHRFEVHALNEGTDKPNTASISISGVVQGEPQQSWRMSTGQRTRMMITVQPN
ncbi:MAG: hypothetical protein H8E44_40350 [Planctomycetes bacterium]|nr:hypothetical protein [Planctomycetota bacterium]